MTSNPLTNFIKATVEKSRICAEKETSENYESLDNMLRQLGVMARELMQDQLKNAYRNIAEKLENGTPLSPSEQDTLDCLIVGDARAYLAQEQDFANWRARMDRLTQEIVRLEGAGLSTTQELLSLQAVCLEAKAVLPDITYYLREKERIERFESSTRNALTAESGKLLAEVVEEMMQSPRM
jgi:hypothetical protein